MKISKSKYAQILATGFFLAFTMPVAAEVSDKELGDFVGKEVRIHGKFSIMGDTRREGNTVHIDGFSFYSGPRVGFLKKDGWFGPIVFIDPKGAWEISDVKSIELSDELGITLKQLEAYNARALKQQELDAPLMSAFNDDDLEMVKVALSNGASANLIDGKGVPLIVAAASNNNIPMVAVLLGAGADVNAMVSSNTDDEISSSFAEFGVSPLTHKFEGFTALHFAVTYEDGELTKLLLSEGGDPNAIASVGSFHKAPKASPLILAANQEHVEVVKALIEAGADVNYKIEDSGNRRSNSMDGVTPLVATKNEEIKRILREAGARS